jgi:hypothetical protein
MKAIKNIIAIELCIVAVLAVLFVVACIQMIDGSLWWAVVAPCSGMIGCMIMDDVSRLLRYLKRRKN